MSTPNENKNKISLKTSDDQMLELEEHLAMESTTIKTFFQDFSRNTIMPLPNVNSWEMVKIIEFCKKIRQLETNYKFGVKKEGRWFLEAFRAEFDEDLSEQNLVFLLCAANYLDIEVVVEVLCHCMADKIKNKPLEYNRDLFGVQKDYTPEEEEKFRNDFAWAFEDPEIDEYKKDVPSRFVMDESQNR